MDRKITFLSDKLSSMLISQIVHEQSNANLYIAISNYFNGIGLNQCFKWFEHQAEEEIHHAKQVTDFLISSGCEDLCPEAVPATELPKEQTPISMMNAYVEREISTTKLIQSMCDQSLEDHDYISFKFLTDFISQQLAEEDESHTRLQIFLTTKDNIVADLAVGELD